MKLAAIIIAVAAIAAQDPALDARVITTVRAAMAPALPFPASDDSGNLPKNESPESEWMVRPQLPGDSTIEILANPLNPDHQARATKAMAQIEKAIEAAQRKSQAQYERAVAEAKRTGKSQDVDGVTLGDEGVAGARVDADSHVIVDIEFNKAAYHYPVPSSIEPSAVTGVSVPGAVATLSVPAHVYRDKGGDASEDRFCAGETQVFFGALAAPQVKRRQGGALYDVTAAEVPSPASSTPGAIRSLAITLRGNEALIAEILRKTDWSQVIALVGNTK